MPLQCSSFTLPPTPDYPLFIVAKRYWLPYGSNAENPAAQTLIVLHSTSFHKETWEPTLQDLFELVAQSNAEVPIRDAWAVDCPNHGESGILNNQVLKDPQFTKCVSLFFFLGFESGDILFSLTFTQFMKKFLVRAMHMPYIDSFYLDRRLVFASIFEDAI